MALKEVTITKLSIEIGDIEYSGAVELEAKDKKELSDLATSFDKAQAAYAEATKKLVEKAEAIGLEGKKIRKPAAAGDSEDAKVRKYAARVGLEVNSRGKIPGAIKSAYEKAKTAGKLQDDEK
ncbi:histone-like nucleoid-structuring protein Lsr2 [Streptomyces sp. NPDC056883]|uniref:Lsr2 family DNA-binding protein n=1 Tax=Streptomyces sp. NPDC056883 TaxID=3345959 RepID=UPI00368C84BE